MAKATGIAQFSQGRSDTHRVDPRILVITDGWNTREDTVELLEHIDQLAQSIAEVGVRKAIEVKLEDGKLVVKDGHCRTRATMLAISKYNADIKTVPVVSVDRYANDADLILNQIISNSGKPLTSIEQAKVFKKLLDMGWNQSDIAKKVGMSNGRISQILGILLLPAEIQAGVAAGAISASLASSSIRAAETNGLKSEAVVAAIQTATAEGRKVRPSDVQPTSRFSIKGCFEASDIDCSQEAIDTGMVTISMPLDEWNYIKDTFKL